jgi:hypothetical protein
VKILPANSSPSVTWSSSRARLLCAGACAIVSGTADESLYAGNNDGDQPDFRLGPLRVCHGTADKPCSNSVPGVIAFEAAVFGGGSVGRQS